MNILIHSLKYFFESILFQKFYYIKILKKVFNDLNINNLISNKNSHHI